MPLPDDRAAAGAGRLDFDDEFRPEFAVWEPGRISSRRNGFGGGLVLPGDHQYVPVWQHFDVVMEKILATGVFELPDQRPLPRELLDPSAATAYGEPWVIT